MEAVTIVGSDSERAMYRVLRDLTDMTLLTSRYFSSLPADREGCRLNVRQRSRSKLLREPSYNVEWHVTHTAHRSDDLV